MRKPPARLLTALTPDPWWRAHDYSVTRLDPPGVHARNAETWSGQRVAGNVATLEGRERNVKDTDKRLGPKAVLRCAMDTALHRRVARPRLTGVRCLGRAVRRRAGTNPTDVSIAHEQGIAPP